MRGEVPQKTADAPVIVVIDDPVRLCVERYGRAAAEEVVEGADAAGEMLL